MKIFKTYSFSRLFALLFIITVWRFFQLSFNDLNLSFDEAQYWHWSKFLSFGYFSKPPVVSWVIALTTFLFGDSENIVRLGSLLAHSFTSISIYFIAKELYSKKYAFYSSIVFATLLGVSFSCLIISTDPFLMCFWGWSLLFFIKAIKNDSWLNWSLTGLFLGMGMLSKYAMIAFLLSQIIYLIWAKKQIKEFISFSKMAWSYFVASFIYMPNFLWNASNNFVSYAHTKANANLSNSSYFHPEKALEFLGSQIGVFGLFFIILLFLAFVFKKHIFLDEQAEKIEKEKQILRARLLYSFSFPLIIIMTIEGFLSRANANWAAASYVSASILVTVYLIQKNKDILLKSIIAFHLIIAVFLYNANSIIKLFNVPLTKKIDAGKRLRKWEVFGETIKKLSDEYPNAILLFDERKIITPQLYYVRPYPFDKVAKFNSSGIIHDHYDLKYDVAKKFGDKDEFLLITRHPDAAHVEKHFKSIKRLNDIKIKIYDDYFISTKVFLLKDFTPY